MITTESLAAWMTKSLAADSERDGALTGSAGDRYRPGTVQAHHFFFMDPA
jgi:hypothetical protein